MTASETTLQGARVLVTGAGGFIGSHLVEALVHEGARVVAHVHAARRRRSFGLPFEEVLRNSFRWAA